MEEANRHIGKIQQRVKELENEFSSSIQNLEEAVVVVRNGKIKNSNEAVHELLGFTHSDLENVSPFVFFPEKQPDGFASSDKITRIFENLKNGESINLNFEVKHKNGYRLNSKIKFKKIGSDNDIYLNFIKPNNESINKVFSFSQKDEEAFSEISKDVPVLFRMSNEKGEYYYFSKHWQKFTGRSLKEEQRGNWQRNIFKEDFHIVQDNFKNAFDNQSKYEILYRLVRQDGEVRLVFESGIPLFDSDGIFLGFLSVTVDVTRIHEVESSLKDSQIKLQALTENAPVLFRMSDEHNRFYYFSKQWLSFTGRTLKEEFENGWMSGIHNEDYKIVSETLELAFAKKKKYEVVFRIRNNSSEYRWIMDSGIPLFTHMGEFNGFISAAIDINNQKLEEEKKSRQKAYRDSEKKLQSSLNNSNLIALTIDENERITYCNKYFLETTGYDHNTVLGRDVNTLISLVKKKRTKKPLGKLISAKGYPESFEATITNVWKEKIYVNFSAVVLYSDSGLPSDVTIIGQDTTEKRKVREELEKTNAKLTDLFDNANDLIQIFKPNGSIIFTNLTWRTKLGYTEEEVSKLKLKDIVHPDSLKSTLENLDQIAHSKAPDKFETIFISKKGTNIFLTGSISCSVSQGKVKEFRGIFYDITEQIRAEKSKNLFHSISSLTIHSSDLAQLYENIHTELGKVINVDNFYIALYDQEREYLNFAYYIDRCKNVSQELLGRPFGKGITEYAITHNQAFVFYENDFYSLNKKDLIEILGDIPKIWIGVPLRLNKRIVGVIAAQSYVNPEAYTKQDLELLEFISGQIALSIDRKQKEEKIREQAGRLEAIFESTSHMIWSINHGHELTSFNSNYSEFIKNFVDENAYYGKKATKNKLGRTHKSDFWIKKYDQTFSGKVVHFEERFINIFDGSELWQSIVLNPIYNETHMVEEISGIGHDITKNKTSELALQESEGKFRNIFESFQDVYFRCDFNGELLLLSPSVKDVLGYEPEMLVGKDITNYYLYSKKTKDLLKKMIRRRSVRNFEASIIDKEGRILQCLCNVRLIYDKLSQKAAIEGVVRDITKLKQANIDMKLAKDIAERSLKVKDLFLANMSHEIRTPMNGIIGMIDLLEGTSVTGEQQNYIGTIKKSSGTLLNILNDILDLSKIEAGKMQLRNSPVKLKNILEKLYALFTQQTLIKNINLYYHLSDNLPEYILVDETRLLQILSNLTSNAIKFTDGGGSINIGMKRANIPGKRHMIKCVVSDSGIGISHENVKKLFTSFSQLDNSTTKTFGGTGLGLAISKELCKLMGGKIGVFSTLGLGSTFWFTFHAERTQKTILVENKIVDQDIKIEGYFKDETPKILLVDDNIVNRQVAGEILKKSGCVVELADCGTKALEMVNENQYDLIFMDIQMPEMDGVTATHKIRELREEVPPVIAMTAYSMKEDRERFLKQGLDDYISKPIKANDLLNKVRQWVKDEVDEAVTEVVQEMNSGEVLNTDVFNQLEKLGGKDMLIQVFGEFIKESQFQIDNCKISLGKNDYDTILINLHTLKGNAGTLGAEKLSKQAEFIEFNLKNNKYDTIEQDIEFLKLTFTEFQNRYKQTIKGDNHG